jgi:hypothetical protein
MQRRQQEIQKEEGYTDSNAEKAARDTERGGIH